MNQWIQLHDFSSQDRNDVGLDEAKHAFRYFDWLSELRKRDELEENDEACDPGFGLVAEDGAILHICPQDSSSCYVHYHYSKVKKLLGFIPFMGSCDHFIPSCSLDAAVALIEHHFAGESDAILQTR